MIIEKPERTHVDLADPGKLLVPDQEVPPGKLCRPVVCQSISPALFIAQMVKPDHRHRIHPELFCRHEPAVSFDNDVVIAPYADRIIKAEFLYTGLYGVDILGLVLPGIALIGLYLLNRQVFDD